MKQKVAKRTAEKHGEFEGCFLQNLALTLCASSLSLCIPFKGVINKHKLLVKRP